MKRAEPRPRRSARLSTGAAAALLAALGWTSAVGCQDSSPSAPIETIAVSSTAGVDADLLLKMSLAPTRATYRGVRSYEARIGGAQSDAWLAYSEEVACDGKGHFALQPLDLTEPVLAPVEEALELNMLALRSGLSYRYRGFRVRHLPTFLDNYTVQATGETQSVAGIKGLVLAIARTEHASSTWRVVVDPATGLVLEASEMDLSGALVSREVFESLDLEPSFDDVVWHLSLNDEHPVDPKNAATVFGFALLEPALLPHGYREIGLARLNEPTPEGYVWARRVYTDGVDVLFFAQGEPAAAAPPPTGPGAPPHSDRLLAQKLGSWNVLDGEVKARRVILIGKVAENALAWMLQSALP